jgi:hypothetical protein
MRERVKLYESITGVEQLSSKVLIVRYQIDFFFLLRTRFNCLFCLTACFFFWLY